MNNSTIAPFKGQQTKFAAASENYVLGGGAGGGGKTELLIQNPLYMLIEDEQRWKRGIIPKSQGWCLLLRRLMPSTLQLVERVRQTYGIVDSTAHIAEKDHIWTFPCGFRVQVGGMEHKNDWHKYYGNEYIWVGYDEATEFEEEQFNQLDSRVRSPDPYWEGRERVRLCTNPVGRGRVWVRKRFVEAAKPEEVVRFRRQVANGKTIEFDQVFIPFRVSDNERFASGQYEARLAGLPPHIRQAILEGNWYIVEGALIGELWNSDTHVIENANPPEHVYIFRSCDWGLGGTSGAPSVVLWWYVDSDNCMTAFHELTFTANCTPERLAGAIKEIEKTYGLWDTEENCSMLRFNPIDPACGSRTPGGPSVIDSMRRMGVWWSKGNNDRVNGLAQVTSRIQRRVGTPPKAGVADKRQPMLRFMKRCKKSIETIPALPMDPNDNRDIDTNSDDHWYDAVRYACMAKVLKPEKPKDEFDDSDDEAPATTAGGKLCYGGW